MAHISFWGGVGVIGSSKVLIEQDGWRVLLDFGLDYSPGQGLYRLGVAPRDPVEHHLRDRLRIGGAPWLPHVYRPEAVGDLSLPAGGDGRTAIFITHGHLDHMGLIGMVDPSIPVYASSDTIRLVDTLARYGDAVAGGSPALQPLAEGEPMGFGPFRITRYPVDHDVMGSSGYCVETENGLVAYTGDIRLHGRRSQESLAFADRAHGARALVIEGTTLTGGFRTPERSEADVDADFERILRDTPGLVLTTLYPRNVERIAAFLARARAAGRDMLWPEPTASFIRDILGQSVTAWGDGAGEVSVADIARRPSQYVVVMPISRWPVMLDLPLGPGSVYLHANGEPLGPFDPLWDLLQEWLRHLHTPFWSIGTGGHASPDDLNRLVERVAPEILFPLHSLEPDRLIPPPGTTRWLPQRGRVFDLAGRSNAL